MFSALEEPVALILCQFKATGAPPYPSHYFRISSGKEALESPIFSRLFSLSTRLVEFRSKVKESEESWPRFLVFPAVPGTWESWG